MAGLDELAERIADISALIHDMQRERGASAVFLGSKGTQMADETAASAGLPTIGARPSRPRLPSFPAAEPRPSSPNA